MQKRGILDRAEQSKGPMHGGFELSEAFGVADTLHCTNQSRKSNEECTIGEMDGVIFDAVELRWYYFPTGGICKQHCTHFLTHSSGR